MRTLDDILIEARAPAGFDFLSVDVEGHELEVLSGFDFARWRPRLILLEDHVGNLEKHRFLQAAGYRLIRRFENNGWYVPRDATVAVGAARTLGDRAQILSRAAVPRRAQCVTRAAPTAAGAIGAISSRRPGCHRAFGDAAPLSLPRRGVRLGGYRAEAVGRRSGALAGGDQACVSS